MAALLGAPATAAEAAAAISQSTALLRGSAEQLLRRERPRLRRLRLALPVDRRRGGRAGDPKAGVSRKRVFSYLRRSELRRESRRRRHRFALRAAGQDSNAEVAATGLEGLEKCF